MSHHALSPSLYIQQRLATFEAERGVRVLFACESGSRTWGFASPDSDYDVRGIFMYPKARYLALDAPDENFEAIEDDFDFQLWDIYKFLRLQLRNNPSTLEWISISNIYTPPPEPLANFWRQLAVNHWWNRQSLLHHYRGIASRHYQKYVVGQPRVKLKKYLYIVRPLLMMEYLRFFDQLCEYDLSEALMRVGWRNPDWMHPAEKSAILHLISSKHRGQELELAAPIPALNEFIERDLARWDATRNTWDIPNARDCDVYRASANRVLRLLLQQHAPHPIVDDIEQLFDELDVPVFTAGRDTSPE